MKKLVFPLLIFAALFWASQACAHFGMVIPSNPMVTDNKDANITLDIAFAHPFEQNGMAMQKPKEFFVAVDGKKIDLTPSLKAQKYLGHDAWKADYKIARPGIYQFAVIPEPYFEKSEDCFIIHYPKTVVASFGAEEGWDKPLGLPVEIIPLTRPFANYAGNVFQGQALLNGKQLAGIDVEVECLNKNGKHIAPNEYFVTQTLKTDDNGIFTFGVPWAGWWGFAALTTSSEKLSLDGNAKDVELGGIMWLEFSTPQVKK